MIEKHRHLLTIVVLLLVTVVGYYPWFIGHSVLTYGDWWFAYPEGLKEYFSLPQAWISNTTLGVVNLSLTFAPKIFFNGLLANFGVSPQLNNQLTYLWPIIIFSTLGFFWLGRKVMGTNLAGFFSAIFYNFNVVTIAIRSGHLTLASAQAVAPFLILLVLKTHETKKLRFALLSGILAYIVSFNEIRVFYLLAGILGLISLYHSLILEKSFRAFVVNSLLTSVILFISASLNIYWILPFVFTTPEPSSGFDFLGRQLFGSQNYNLLNSLTSWNIWWTGGRQSSSVQPIPAYFWTIPVLAMIGLVLNRQKKYSLLFGIIAIIGLFFSKQSAPPFTRVYAWLYYHLPGFNAFREASKFYFYIHLGFSVFIGGLVSLIWSVSQRLKRHRLSSLLIIMSIFILFTYNARPIVTKEIEAIFVPRTIPLEYLTLKEFINSQPEYFKTLSIPTHSRWQLFTSLHPNFSYIEALNSQWDYLVTRFRQERTRHTEQDVIFSTFDYRFRGLLTLSSIKYVIVPLQDLVNDDDFFAYYGDRRLYLDKLNSLSFLKKTNVNVNDIAVYENPDFRPKFYLSDQLEKLENFRESHVIPVSYLRLSSTHYQLTLPKRDQPTYLNFTERFHPDWRLKPDDFNWLLSLIWPSYFLSDSYHSANGARLNSYYLPPGSSQTLHLYFKPQAYVNLGLIISSVSFFTIVVLIIYDLKRNL